MEEWTLEWVDNGEWDWDDVENRFIDPVPIERATFNSTPLENPNWDSDTLSLTENIASITYSSMYMADMDMLD
ncbi:hypothetical protein BGZ76_004705, partial [Entomortierella beljakovae]